MGTRIGEAKSGLGDALVILGHHYQRDEVIQFADYRGDSLGLSRRAAEAKDARYIVFCGVDFMAETAVMLCAPSQIVCLPAHSAVCPMAQMADIDEAQVAWQHLTSLWADDLVPVTYQNSYATVKAFCGRRGGAVCTSANAQAILRWALKEKSVDIFGSLAEHFAARRLLYHLQRFSETFTQKELNLKHADRFFDTLYKWGGWLFFTRPAKILYGILTVCGLVFLLREVLAGTYPLMSTAGSYGLGLIMLMLLNYVMMFFHECGHALTCKSYGRQVPRAGVLLYLGSLAWFVDTTDIWMAPKRARIAVSLAGPFATVLLGSVLATVVAISPPSPLHSTLFQAAFMGFAGTPMNMTPLIECDGYFVLMDWLEIPMLRAKSLAFVREKLLSRLFRRRSPFSREERIFSPALQGASHRR